MTVSEHPLIAARRRAEAFHVLWHIDHDGSVFVVTMGEPAPDGRGADDCARFAPTFEEAQQVAARAHDEFLGVNLVSPRPALKFSFSDAALAAASS